MKKFQKFQGKMNFSKKYGSILNYLEISMKLWKKFWSNFYN